MTTSRFMTAAALVAVLSAGSACTDRAADDTKRGAADALDATRAGADKVAEKGQEVASAAGAVMTDGWITTKVKAKFADETILKGSDISVKTTDHAVTLRGNVPSSAAETRAMVIANGTEGVTHVVNELIVK